MWQQHNKYAPQNNYIQQKPNNANSNNNNNNINNNRHNQAYHAAQHHAAQQRGPPPPPPPSTFVTHQHSKQQTAVAKPQDKLEQSTAYYVNNVNNVQSLGIEGGFTRTISSYLRIEVRKKQTNVFDANVMNAFTAASG